MAASEGVDLEWCIIDKLGGNAGGKTFSNKILSQGEKCAANIRKFAGSKKLEAWHSDDSTNPFRIAIFGNPEPKTDIVLRIGGKVYSVSVKMAGAVQLASGQGSSTADLFEAAASQIKNGTKSKVLKSIITELRTMPTRLLSDSNKSRILSEASDKVIGEFIRNGKIIQDKSYDYWLKHNKVQLMEMLLQYVEKDKDFTKALLYEALTGKISLKKYKGAPADSMISPAGFYLIDDRYVEKIMSKVKFDIRGKSRSGITGIAFRIDLRA